MKNHIAIKFIAVLLCAVTLLGAVGSAVGIFVMSELDLFDKSVEQVRTEQMLRNSEVFAQEVALRYASQTLGGCSEEMLDNHYGAWISNYYQEGQFGYSILDAEGNPVYTYGEIASSGAAVYNFPVIGQYLHLVSTETETQRNERLNAEAASYSANFTIGDETYVMDALPPEGAHVTYASFCDVNGALVYEAYNENSVGFLHYNQAGQVVFNGSCYAMDAGLTKTAIAGAYFQLPDGSVVYEATSRDGVGSLYFNDAGQLNFISGDLPEELITVESTEEPPVETEPQIVEEPVEETAPVELVPVYYAAFYNEEDEKIYRVRSTKGVGFLSLDQEGRLTYRGFQVEEEQLPEDVILTGTYFLDEEDNTVFELYGDESIGTISYTDNGQLIFTTAAPVEGFDPVALNSPETEEAEEVAEETEAEETEETKEPSSASDIPEDATEVTEAAETVATAATEAPTEPVVTEAPTEPAVTEAPAEPAVTEVPAVINGKPLDEYQVDTDGYYDHQLGESVYVSYVRVPMPEYTVEMHLAPGALGMEGEYQLLTLLHSFGGYLFPALGICLLVFAICAVYLCCAAGRKPGSDEVRAAGLNSLPLDLYTGLAFLGVVLAANIGVEMGWYRLEDNFLFSCILAVAMAFLIALIVVAYCFAIAAQIKTAGGYWWRNTLCMRFILLFMKFGIWLEKFLAQKFFPFAGRLCKAAWTLLWGTTLKLFRLWEKFAGWFIRVLRRFSSWLYDRLHRFFSLIPMTWQWILGGLLLMLLGFANDSISDTAGMLALLLGLGIVFYVSHCFGILSEGAKRMGKGDLNTKVEDKLLIGCFQSFADDLNDLADVAVVAAQKQLKSERMKTELITNVSHDIKTPLTSIINYVDLLQKSHTEEERKQYLEVLDRQSLRLKKLIEDLMDMSKASTGNMAVEIATVDAVESINQALGEFADKLAAAQLVPMFRYADKRVSMRADGRLVWRVLSNVLSNAVKYAMPGTRLYIDLMELEGKVVISLKNISREELNVDADELMERFVRGDDSRNTEGSGLGLNIAKSLMELQKGQLQLLVDGDLFKVTLIFPGA